MSKRIRPEAVIDVLTSAQVRFMLAGAYAIGGWTGRPRATLDVDVLVTARHVRKAVLSIESAFPSLETRDTPVVTRFVDPKLKTAVIDVMKPNQPLFENALRHSVLIAVRGRKYRIPNLEFALAMKFAAMVSPWRDRSKKLMDGADFMAMLHRNPEVNLEKLSELGQRVYRSGGREILELVRKVRSGEPVQF